MTQQSSKFYYGSDIGDELLFLYNRVLSEAVINVLEEHGYTSHHVVIRNGVTALPSTNFAYTFSDSKESFIYNLRGGDNYYYPLIRQEYFRLYRLHQGRYTES